MLMSLMPLRLVVVMVVLSMCLRQPDLELYPPRLLFGCGFLVWGLGCCDCGGDDRGELVTVELQPMQPYVPGKKSHAPLEVPVPDCDTTSIQGRLCQGEAPRRWWCLQANTDPHDVDDVCLGDDDDDDYAVCLKVVRCRTCSEALKNRHFDGREKRERHSLISENSPDALAEDLGSGASLVFLRACGRLVTPSLDRHRTVDIGSALMSHGATLQSHFVLRSSPR